MPVLFCAALYLLATGRWGSYVGAPELSVFIGDVLLLLALGQTLWSLRRSGTRPRDCVRQLGEAPLALQLALALLLWTAIRLGLGLGGALDAPLLALRDVAPYAYSVAALLAFFRPARDGVAQHRLVYAALAAHAAWVILSPRLVGLLDGLVLGGTPIFTTRPDFDGAVLGASIGLALHALLLPSGPRRPVGSVLLLAFTAANAYALSTVASRAGFLAAVVGIGSVLALWALRGAGHAGSSDTIRRGAALAAAVALLGVAVVATPPGQRLVQGVQGLRGEATQASGTIEVRQYVWGGVLDYVSADARRTAIGVGFGPDFVEASGTEYALEGTEYDDVRSPHNYLLGTLGRLGTLGGLLVTLVLGAGVLLALRALAGSAGTVTALAALVLLTLPVTALLGVVLESPFGAIPYFWALGQLARSRLAAQEPAAADSTRRS